MDHLSTKLEELQAESKQQLRKKLGESQRQLAESQRQLEEYREKMEQVKKILFDSHTKQLREWDKDSQRAAIEVSTKLFIFLRLC